MDMANRYFTLFAACLLGGAMAVANAWTSRTKQRGQASILFGQGFISIENTRELLMLLTLSKLSEQY